MITFITPDNFSEHKNGLGGTTIWIPILSDQMYHYADPCNRISLIYIYSVDTGYQYVLNVNHIDCEKLTLDYIMHNIPDGDRICYNSKYLSDSIVCRDADILVWYSSGLPIKIDDNKLDIFNFYNRKYNGIRNINDVIPIMRIITYCQYIRDEILVKYPEELDSGYQYYDKIYRSVLNKLDSVGISVDRELLDVKHTKYFSGDLYYTEYNPCTLTGRPSSRFGGLNFNALNKTDGTRKLIVPRIDGGRLFEFDYDSYHIRLIAELIKFKLPDGNLHEYFAKQYFGNKDITPELYDKSKKLSFRLLYSDVPDQYLHIEYFREINIFIDKLWDFYLNHGYVKCPISGRKFRNEWYDDMSKSKLFSYIIQSYETELNVMVLDKILHYLYKTNSKLIMYTYDSFLIDYDPSDGHKFLTELIKIMNSFGFPVKVKAGINYHDMVEVTL